MATKQFSKGEALRLGWSVMKSNLGFFIGMLVVVGLIQIVSNIIRQFPLLWILSIVMWVISIIIQIGLIKISLKFADNQKGELADLFSSYPLFFKFLLASILYGLIVLGGLILLIVPGIIWSIKFGFYGYFIVDKRLGPVEALKRSSEVTMGAKWNLFLFELLTVLINFLGALCLLIGLFATIPTTLVAYAFVYRKLLAQTEVPEPSFGVPTG